MCVLVVSYHKAATLNQSVDKQTELRNLTIPPLASLYYDASKQPAILSPCSAGSEDIAKLCLPVNLPGALGNMGSCFFYLNVLPGRWRVKQWPKHKQLKWGCHRWGRDELQLCRVITQSL